MVKIFLDDERMPQDVFWVDIGPSEQYCVVRNFEEFKAKIDEMLESGIVPDISFDHDLGDFRNIDTADAYVLKYGIHHRTDIEMTGYSCQRYFQDRIMDLGLTKDLQAVECTFHSMNIIMRKRMMDEWLSFKDFHS